jgi:AraC-like DNA-binding protein
VAGGTAGAREAAAGEAGAGAAGGGAATLADVAAGCGYYDQAHLAREFRALAGCPPAAWLADEFRNVQSSDLDPAETGRHDR